MSTIYRHKKRGTKGPLAMTIDELAQIIRTVDGENKLGAGALAEAILAASPPSPAPAAESGAVAESSRQIIHELAADIRDRLSKEEGSANWRNAQRIVELSRPTAPSACMGRVTVKGLEWERFERGGNSYFAETLLGRYSAWDFHDNDGYYMPPSGYAGGLEAAKVAAQAHFDSINLAALASPPDHGGGEGWQSIETAPKNRKVLAAYRNPLGNWRIVTACYHTELPWSDDAGWDSESEFAPEAWYEESDSQDSILPTASLPTHWQLLPAPPSIPTQESEDGR